MLQREIESLVLSQDTSASEDSSPPKQQQQQQQTNIKRKKETEILSLNINNLLGRGNHPVHKARPSPESCLT